MLCICFPALCWVSEVALDYLERIVFLHNGMQLTQKALGECNVKCIRSCAADLDYITHVWEVPFKLSLWTLQQKSKHDEHSYVTTAS